MAKWITDNLVVDPNTPVDHVIFVSEGSVIGFIHNISPTMPSPLLVPIEDSEEESHHD